MEPEQIEIGQKKFDYGSYYSFMEEQSTDKNIGKLYGALALQVSLNKHYNERLQELERIVLHGVRIEYEDEIEDEDDIVVGQRMENPRWEYATFFFEKDVFENEAKVVEDLDGYGKEGWELVTVSNSIAFFKRRL